MHHLPEFVRIPGFSNRLHCPSMQSRRKAAPKFMLTRVVLLFALLFGLPLGFADGQSSKPPRIGIIHPGGSQRETIDGLREGLRDSGWSEDKIVLDVRDVKGDAAAAEKEAQAFEKENVRLLLALTTPIIARVKAATGTVPIVFCIGSDPVTGGLVDGFAKPGGRLTGVHYLVRDLTGKRLEVLKELLPKVSRVLTFYDPTNRVAAEGAALAREEGKRLGIKLIERHVRSVEDVKAEAQKLKAGDTDAYLFTPDPMVGNQSALIIDIARAKKMPTMFQEHTLVAQGALASYGQNYREIGRLAARYVQQILAGANPKDMKIETVDSVELAINLRTAKQLGVTIPPQMLARAQRVVK